MKKIIYFKLMVLLLLLINSCEKMIDLAPLDRIGMGDYWKTTSDLRNYMLQFYPEFPTHAGGGIAKEESNSDNLILVSADAIMNGERSTRTGNWRNEWSNIRKVNIFFDNYHNCEDNFEAYQHHVGEAHFFRAWFYFDLLKSYGDLPWYSTVLYPDSEDELMKPRQARTVIVDSIMVDLDKAALYLKSRSASGNLLLSKEAALAFKTRVALYEGTWQKYHANTDFGTPGANPTKYFQACVTAAEELMGGQYTRGIYNTGKPESDYYTLFGLDNMSNINEVLLWRAYNAADGFGNRVQHFTTFNTDQMAVTWELVTSYLGRNGQPYDYLGLASTNKGNAFLTKIAEDIDPRLKSTVWIPGDLRSARFSDYFDKPFINKSTIEISATGFQVKKTSNPNSPVAGGQWAEASETGYIILRYGEVLLNYAEAKYELDQTVSYTQLNLLRTRVGMPAFTVNPQSADLNPMDYGYPISDALYEIRRERRVELALEGYRQQDYMRWAAHALFKGKRPKGYPFNPSEFPGFNPRLDANGLIDYLANDIPNGYSFRPTQDYLTSIPQDELTLNPSLVQNPGW